MHKKLRVGILGATGMVGQRFVTLLDGHPWFEVVSLAASPRSAGKSYADAVADRWLLEAPVPKSVKSITVQAVENDLAKIADEVDLVFCALDMDKESIKNLEVAYAAAGVPVISNNSAHRWTTDVPILMPEINPEHIKIIEAQRQNRGWDTGLIAVKPNCSIQSYVSVMTALQQFKPLEISVTSLQAVSGAGKTLQSWPEMADSIVPFIAGEEDKSENEPMKIWGDVSDGTVMPASLPKISAACIRVPVSDGHLADVSVTFTTKPTRLQILTALASFNPLVELELPSAPHQFIHYFEEDDRPQTALDRDRESGMGISVGRLREDKHFDWRFVTLAHNTIRGAAGGAILMAELLVAKGYIV